MNKSIRIILFFLLIHLNSFSQTQSKDKQSGAVIHSLSLYNNFIGTEADLYNGRLYTNYLSTIAEGIPFLDTTKALPANIVYNNILYEDIPMLYDILKNKVVVNNNNFMIEVANENISSFSLGGHSFKRLYKENLGRDMETDFYEIVYEGKNNVLLKHYKKTLQQDITSGAMRRIIHDKNTYYILKDGLYNRVSRKKDVLNVYKNHRREINHFIRKQKIDFNKRRINNTALSSVAAYYDELEKNKKP